MHTPQAREEFARYAQDKGLRHTPQRSQIIDVFLGTERHVTVQQLHDLVKRKHKNIGYATVARTVKLMTEAGICRAVDFGDGVQRYEHEFGHEHHDHLICVACGRFIEVVSPAIERLQAQLAKKHGFSIESHRLDIFGRCGRCRKKTRNRKTPD